MGDDPSFSPEEILDLAADGDSPESRWWVRVGMMTGGPPLTAAADTALAIALEADFRSRGRDAEEGELIQVSVSAPLVTLIALALVQAVRNPPPDTRMGVSWFNVYRNPQPARAQALLADEAAAREIAAMRPPADVHGDLRDVVTRPDSDMGTVPSDVAAALDRLLSEDPAGWLALRTQAHDALASYCEDKREPAQPGPLNHLMRQWRVRRAWWDQPDRSPRRDPHEPGPY